MIRVRDGGTDHAARAISVHHNGQYRDVIRAWVAVEGSQIGSTDWISAGRYDWPDGLTVSVSQEQFFGGDVTVAWAPSHSEPGQVELEINGRPSSGAVFFAGQTSVTIPGSRFDSGDSIRARMRYGQHPTFGSWGPWSFPHIYTG